MAITEVGPKRARSSYIPSCALLTKELPFFFPFFLFMIFFFFKFMLFDMLLTIF